MRYLNPEPPLQRRGDPDESLGAIEDGSYVDTQEECFADAERYLDGMAARDLRIPARRLA